MNIFAMYTPEQNVDQCLSSCLLLTHHVDLFSVTEGTSTTVSQKISRPNVPGVVEVGFLYMEIYVYMNTHNAASKNFPRQSI